MRSAKLRSRRFAATCAVLFLSAVAGADDAPEMAQREGNGTAPEIRLAQGQTMESSRREKLNEAERLLEKEEFEQALALADGVLADVENDRSRIEAEVLSSLRKKALSLDYEIRLAWFRMLMKDARHAVSEGRYLAATESAANAKSLVVAPVGALANNPAIFDDEKIIAERFLDFCRRAQRNVDQQNATTVDSFEPQSALEKKQIRQKLQEAATFMKSNRLQDAQMRVEQIFLIDPCNAEAIALAGKIYNKLYAFGEARRRADLESVYSHSEWQWVEPVFPEINVGSSAQDQGHVKVSDNDRVLARMDQIIFPLVEFEDADVSAVLDWIGRRSATYSPDHRAIAISKVFPSGSNWRVSLSLKNIPMSVVLRYICQQTGLKYRADNDSVFIGPEVDEMVSRRFTVPSALSNYVTGGGAADAGASVEDGGEAGGESAASASAGASGPTEEDWKTYFRERGIGFPDGSKVNYSSQAKMLIVRNTPENLQQLDILLRQLETVTNKPLIMIEIKSVEVKETDMQELGFDWALGTNQSDGTVSYGVGSNLYMDPITGETYLKGKKSVGWMLNQGLNTVEKGVLAAIRGDGNTNSTVVEKLNIFPALFGSTHPFGSDNPLNINLTINALDQNKRVETLAAPKVVTSNDVEAEVSLGKTYYFPDSWDTLEVEVDTGDNTSTTTITPPVPNFPEEGTEIGIKFKVKPQVLADNRTIRMTLEPTLSSYEGDDRYDMYLYYDRYENGLPVQMHIRGERFSVFKPIINRREMKLECDLDNGETVVLGGLVKSNTVSRVDKVPLLGDLPLIGRLFQSHADNAERTNMLFFVTARLLSYDGVPIERNSTPGLPDFNR